MVTPKNKNYKIITLGEVLMRLTTSEHNRFMQSTQYDIFYGGAAANVSVCLSELGFKTTHLTTLPDQDLGKSVTRFLKAHGVDTSHIQYYKNSRLGLYFFEKGHDNRSGKIIYDRLDTAFSKIEADHFDWELIFRDACWLHWTGITPALSLKASEFCKKAIEKASEMGLTISGDINYRNNLWAYGKKPEEIMPTLISKTNIIIASERDIKNCLRIEEDSFKKSCTSVFTKYDTIHTIVKTNRKIKSSTHHFLAATLLTRDSEFHSKEFEIAHIIDRIGTGDAFVAGLIFAILTKKKEKVIDFAVATSVFKHTIPGDVNIVNIDEIDQLVSGHQIGRLLR